MPELIDQGHVYIAVPPLYKVKLGNQEFYFEKDAQLEELLARERIPSLEVTDRDANAVKLTEAKWGKFSKALDGYDGYLARLRADFGAPAADFMITHRLVEVDTETPAAVERAITSAVDNGYALSVVEKNDDGFIVRVIETATSAARNVRIPVELIASPIYANVRKVYARLYELMGPPPFVVATAKRTERAETFDQLRDVVLDLAKEGLQLSRFKGLGEMNDDQLWETTMDPSRRLLVRVTVDDAAAADLVFSTLMGDQVEPRREFIEQNAKDVKFLDV